jgi:hypothetical protein
MKESLFVIQVFLPLRAEGQRLRRQVHDLIGSAPAESGYIEKHKLYRRVADLVVPVWDRFEYGVWEYSEDAARAKGEFRQWVDGTIADARGAERTDLPIESRYLFLTQAFLLGLGTKSDRKLAKRCRIPDAELWRRSTFRALLLNIPEIDFADVRSDAIFLRPGIDELGLSPEEMRGEDYEYLHRLT